MRFPKWSRPKEAERSATPAGVPSRMTVFRKINLEKAADYEATITVSKREDGIVVGRIVGMRPGPTGTEFVTFDPDDLPVPETFGPAAELAGSGGVVGVYDPQDLWASDWPPLQQP